MDRLSKSVLFALLGPAARLREAAGVPSKELERWVRLSSFRSLRDQGKTISETAEELGISVPTASRIAKRLREDFLSPDETYELPKRLLFALQEKPLSEARFLQLFPRLDQEELKSALGKLETQGRIRLEPGRTPTYHVVKREERLVGPDASSRIGALESLLRSLSNLVRVRFFEEQDAGFARTLTFRVRAEQQAELRKLYEETIWPALRELDAQAQGDDGAEPVQFTVFWAPAETKRKERSGT